MKNIINKYVPEDLADIVVSNIYDTVVVGCFNTHKREGGHIKSSFGIAIRIFTLREAIKHLSENYYYEPHIWPVEKELTPRKKLYNSTVRGYVGESVDEAIIGKGMDVYSDPLLIEMMVEYDGMNIKNVPKIIPNRFITRELVIKAVKNSNSNNVLQYVPESVKTLEICQLALQKNHFSLVHFPKSLPVEFWAGVVKKYPWAIEYIPERFRTAELCAKAMKDYGNALLSVPKDILTEEMCYDAVSNYGMALMYVPDKFRTDRVIRSALANNPRASVYL